MIATPAPILGKNERIIFEIPNIEIKSIEFRLYLTNRRLFLAEDNTRLSSPIDVPIPVISSIKSGQKISDEPTLILSIRAPDGSQKKMTLTFLQDFSGMRDMESDYLKKELEGLISEYVPASIPQAPPSSQPVSPMGGGIPLPHERPATTGATGPGGVLLQAHNIYVKSQEFTIKLTKNNLSLTDPNHPNKPASISIKSVRNVDTAQNEQSEPVIALNVESPNGEMRTMRLTFSHWHKGNRWQERDTWAGAIRDIISTGGSITHIPGLGSQTPQPAPRQPQVNAPPSGMDAGFSARPPDNRFCPECGGQIPTGAKFCLSCGAPAGGSVAVGYGGGQTIGSTGGGIIDADHGADDLFPAMPPKKPVRRTKMARTPRRRKPSKKKVSRKASRDPLGLGSGGSSYSPDESVAGRLIGFIRAPADTFRMTKGQDPLEALSVLLIALAVFGFATGIIFQLYAGSLDAATYPVITSLKETGSMIFFVIEIIILGIIYAVFNGVLLHIGLLITGNGEDILDDIRIAAYSLCPFAVAGLIPLFGLLIAPLWAFYLQFTGARETYNLDGGKAAMAAAVPVIIILMLFLFFIGEGETGFKIFGGA
ncbi:MAG: YIP1 family protein [Methanomicrobiaceae archaeon]|nr:YIP1 family protein [Methanomicrobiaceae archaeon]